MYLAKLQHNFAKLQNDGPTGYIYSKAKMHLDADEHLDQILYMFVKRTNVAEGASISLQTQRNICYANDTWHRNGVDKVGILCVDRKNINGGIHLLKRTTKKIRKYKAILEPGNLLIFDDNIFLHQITPLFPDIPELDAWQDLIIVSCIEKPV